MSQLSKSQLSTENIDSFPNNTSGLITPELLRNFNTDMIDSNVNQTAYTQDSASFDSRINSLDEFSSSLDATFATDAQLAALSTSLNLSKLDTSSFNTYSSSQAAINQNLNTSINSYTASNDIKWNTLGGQSGSWVTSAITASSLTTASFSSGSLTFTKGNGSQFSVTIPDVSGSQIDINSLITTGSLTGTQYISGALVFTGSARIQIATASFVNVGGGSGLLNLQYNPSASALSYYEVNTNLPQYINQAVKVGAITSGSIVGGFVKVMPNPSLIATGTTSSINEIGLEWVSQSSTDYREWFGYNGNPQSDGEKALLVQRGLHKVAGNGLGFSLASAASYSVGTPIYWDNVNAQGAMTVTRPTSGQVLRLGYIAAIQDDPSNPYVREMWYDPFWEEGQTFYNAKLSGSVVLTDSNLVTSASFNSYTSSQDFKNSTYATTGSNTFTGAQIVSSSVTLFANSLTVRNAANTTTISPTLITASSGSAGVNTVVSTTIARGYLFVTSASLASTNQVGLVPGPVPFGGHNAAPAGGGISVYSSSVSYYPIQFQPAAAYTDGRVTFATPISASVSFTSSLQNGYFWVGDASNANTQIVTSSFVSNTADTYTSTAAVQQIVTLTQSEWNSISGSSNSNTLYIII